MMMESEVLAEKLYETYAAANVPSKEGMGWIRSGQESIRWAALPWEQRQRWRAVSDEVMRRINERPVEDWHGRTATSS